MNLSLERDLWQSPNFWRNIPRSTPSPLDNDTGMLTDQLKPPHNPIKNAKPDTPTRNLARLPIRAAGPACYDRCWRGRGGPYHAVGAVAHQNEAACFCEWHAHDEAKYLARCYLSPATARTGDWSALTSSPSVAPFCPLFSCSAISIHLFNT